MGHVQFTSENAVTVAQLHGFDEVMDVRSPAEFAEDHIPGAVNHPVLDDEERDRIGKLYKHDRFEARRLGAALVAANLARHLQCFNYPARWRPLVYCWRGGKRSAAMMRVLREIGWDAHRLEGGYKAYRRAVVGELATLPKCFRYQVICGPTGSGKSRLLSAIGETGGQVLDLEAMAKHRGSVLGNLPQEPQPTQKMFESRIWGQLNEFNKNRPVFVEAESKKIGALTVPSAIIEAVWQSECIRLETPLETRLELLRSEYRHFFDQPEVLKQKLEGLSSLHGKEMIERWQEMATPNQWRVLVAELLDRHYDPAYEKSTVKNFARRAQGLRVELKAPDELPALALQLIRNATLASSDSRPG